MSRRRAEPPRYHVGVAYLLWFFGGMGMMGFHRFYLGKVGTGVLWFMSAGVMFLGGFYDAVTLPMQVDAANRKANPPPVKVIIEREEEPLERALLRVAEKNQGRVTPVQVAASSDWSIDQVSEKLEAMVKKGLCEMRVSKAGTVIYRFAEFDPENREFEV